MNKRECIGKKWSRHVLVKIIIMTYEYGIGIINGNGTYKWPIDHKTITLY